MFGLAMGTCLAGAGLNCGSGDNGSGDDSGAAFDTYVEGPYLCDFFTEVGAPCPQASPNVCFPLCTDGGCYCVATASGPVWECSTDLSCLPESGPLDDSGNNPPPDGFQGDDGGGFDAGEDSGTDAGIDTGADAPADAGTSDAEEDAGDAPSSSDGAGE
jgi:hypothetical protein